MLLKYFLLGLFIKGVASFDDTLTHLPILMSITKTRRGKIAYAIGDFLAICFAIILAIFFSELIKKIPYYRYIVVTIIFLLAIGIYFKIFGQKQKEKIQIKQKKEIEKELKIKKVSFKRLIKLLITGFFISFITILDDIVVFSPLFFQGISTRIYSIAGILTATILQLVLVVYFAKKLSKIKYREKIASFALIILGILILFGII